MKNELLIKKCASCGALVKVIEDCTCENCGIKCCGEEMKLLVPNSVDAAVEKHIPTYQLVEDEIFVNVNHVMEKEHFIEWICLVADNKEFFVRLYPEQMLSVVFLISLALQFMLIVINMVFGKRMLNN